MRQRGIWFLVIVLALAGASVFVNLRTKPQLGLDIAGGVRFTIRADLSKLNRDEMKRWPDKARDTIRILERRAQRALGVLEATVYRKGEDRFIVELPGFTDENKAREIIRTSARLEYYHARNVVTERAPSRPYAHFTVQGEEGEETRFKRRGRPESEWLKPGTPEYERMFENWDFVTGGETLTGAGPEPVGDGIYNIELSFNVQGAEELNRFAVRVMNRREWIAAVLDKQVISFAYLQDGVTFPRGQAIIEGRFTAAEATRISNLLNSGALPVDLMEENVNRISPSVGTQALSQILTAGAISFVMIAAFLLIYYMFPGFVAFLALVTYTLLCYAVFKLLGVTFSLAAIAGFILSIGMAVDANILIFERLKEELRAGRTLMTAIDLGFKRAFPAILDSNTCTIITCVVLANIGTGPVKGFATTLMIGVLISLFTAVTVTRSLLVFLVGSGIGKNDKLYGLGRGWFGERLEAGADIRPLNIVGRMGRYFAISFLIILPGLVFMAMGGLKPNVEFRGGIESVVVLPKGSSTSSNVINTMLERAGLHGANTKFGDPVPETGSGYLAFITLPLEENPELQKLIRSASTEEKFKGRAMIVKAVGADSSLVQKQGRSGAELAIKDEVGFEETGPAVREETVRGAIIGIIVASALVVLYLAIRFGVAVGGFWIGLRFGLSAIAALLHDVFVVLGLAAVAGYFRNWEVSQLTITAMLTVIGFSVHDTIVIFDRIRENLRRPLKGETFDNLVNRSITQSFARSLNTSGTVIVTLAILVFIGSATPDLKHFNAAMLVGILSGTYSSIFNAAPILVLWERIVAKRRGALATIMQERRLRTDADADDKTVWRPDEGQPGGEKYAQVKRRRR